MSKETYTTPCVECKAPIKVLKSAAKFLADKPVLCTFCALKPSFAKYISDPAREKRLV